MGPLNDVKVGFGVLLYDLDIDQEELIPPYEKKPERQYFFFLFFLPALPT